MRKKESEREIVCRERERERERERDRSQERERKRERERERDGERRKREASPLSDGQAIEASPGFERIVGVL